MKLFKSLPIILYISRKYPVTNNYKITQLFVTGYLYFNFSSLLSYTPVGSSSPMFEQMRKNSSFTKFRNCYHVFRIKMRNVKCLKWVSWLFLAMEKFHIKFLIKLFLKLSFCWTYPQWSILKMFWRVYNNWTTQISDKHLKHLCCQFP